jgi:hypothetical protein
MLDCLEPIRVCSTLFTVQQLKPYFSAPAAPTLRNPITAHLQPQPFETLPQPPCSPNPSKPYSSAPAAPGRRSPNLKSRQLTVVGEGGGRADGFRQERAAAAADAGHGSHPGVDHLLLHIFPPPNHLRPVHGHADPLQLGQGWRCSLERQHQP